MSLKDMRDELRELRKHNSSVKAVSKMKKTEIALELEKLRGKREETPAAASVMSHKSKPMEPKITDVKVAKEREFPMMPAKEMKEAKKKTTKATVVGGGGAVAVEAKMSKKDMLRKMLEEMEDD